MKKYIGIRNVEAEPMTMGEAFEKELLHKGGYQVSKKDNKGYHVKYDYGYESWLPSEAFEKAYKVADTTLDRVLIEEDMLSDRFMKLYTVLNCDELSKLDSISRAMLDAQCDLMYDYLELLRQRVSRMTSGEGNYAGFSFSVAISLLYRGNCVKRKDWTNKFIFKQVPTEVDKASIPDMESIPESAKQIMQNLNLDIKYKHQILLYDCETGVASYWAPTSEDIFQSDWELVSFNVDSY